MSFSIYRKRGNFNIMQLEEYIWFIHKDIDSVLDRILIDIGEKISTINSGISKTKYVTLNQIKTDIVYIPYIPIIFTSPTTSEKLCLNKKYSDFQVR